MVTPHRKTVLDNGLRVITEYVPHVRSVTLGVWVRAGSRYETAGQHGIAHFLEHMLFKGTATRDAYQIAQRIESLGGYLNAFTGRELNCYFVRVLDEHASIAVDLLADILQHSVFDPAEIEKEKRVVLDEIKGMEDSPEELVQEYFTTLVWTPHPLSRAIMGTESSVSAFTRDDLFAYMQTRYRASDVYIIAAGHINHDQLAGMASEAFHLASSGGHDGETPPVPPPANRHRVYPKDIAQAHLCVGGYGLAYPDDHKYALFVLNTILGGGMTSRLFQSIREDAGLAYSIYSDLELCMDTGLIGISAGTDVCDVPRVLEMIYQECERMRRELVREQEINDAKSQLTGSLLLSMENMGSVMTRIARMEIYLDRYDSIEETVQAIEAVTREQVQALADELLHPDRLCIAVLGPVDADIPLP